MKKSYWIIALTLAVIGCTDQSTEETTTETKVGFHFSPTHGKENNPIGFFREGNNYHLFYTTGSDQWGHAISGNFVHWRTSDAIDVPENALGDVIQDEFRMTEFSSNDNSAWIIIYNDDNELKLRYSGDHISWEKAAINVPATAQGNPKITWYEPTERWIMTLTNNEKVHLLSSQTLTEWEVISQMDIEGASQTILFQIGQEWGLLFQGESSTYQLGSFNGNEFLPRTERRAFPYGTKKFAETISSIKDELWLINSNANNLFSLPRRLSIDDEDAITSFFPSQLNEVVTSKRRGKISSLRGDGPAWYQFEIDSIADSMELLISNENGELLYLSWNADDERITIDKTSVRKDAQGGKELIELSLSPQEVKIDLIIDSAIVELFINDGQFQFSIPVNPIMAYDKVDVKVDNLSYDARAILYGIGVNELIQ